MQKPFPDLVIRHPENLQHTIKHSKEGMPYKFSPSNLSLLKECKRCFWLQFNKNIKRPQGIFPSLPSGMDKILKAHFDSYRDKGELPPELKGQQQWGRCIPHRPHNYGNLSEKRGKDLK